MVRSLINAAAWRSDGEASRRKMPETTPTRVVGLDLRQTKQNRFPLSQR